MDDSTFDQVYETSEGCQLTVESTAGDIVLSGWDDRRVAVRSAEGHARISREEQMLKATSAGGGTDDLFVRVPRSCAVLVRVVSGNVTLEGLSGLVDVQSMSGDLLATGLEGDLRAQSVSGDIHLRRCHLRSLQLDTVSGDSVVESSLDEDGEYFMRSVSGDAQLLLPHGQTCSVEGNLLSGDLVCPLPHETISRGWGKLVVQVNGGGPYFRIRSASGDVHIDESKELAGQKAEAEKPRGRETKPLNEGAFAAEQEADAAQGEAASASDQRMRILKAIEEGSLSVADGLAQIERLS